ncbi:hypothetical protein [Sphingomonas bacterium]|uniref:hypothetical protein n=1 Tax=Sphingomonas bacterium TaxID=1895847 RepID=UPI0015764C85|nr:hypothetical protein [Sphingomonas bacterium]
MNGMTMSTTGEVSGDSSSAYTIAMKTRMTGANIARRDADRTRLDSHRQVHWRLLARYGTEDHQAGGLTFSTAVPADVGVALVKVRAAQAIIRAPSPLRLSVSLAELRFGTRTGAEHG